jgi:hypothetical protein
MEITVDPHFAYVCHNYGGGQIVYAHSAPRLGINLPAQEHWIAKAMGDDPIHFGGVLYATTEKGK